MADDGRLASEPLKGAGLQLEAADNLYQLLRRVESRHRAAPRVGRALRLMHDVVRLGQEPSLAFAPGAVASVVAPAQSEGGGYWRLLVNCFGLLGPNGPLPLHLTEYVRQRQKHHKDHAFARFLDLFHHRMLSFLYRAWADAQPAVQRDRPETDRFSTYLGALQGIGMPSLRDRDALPDSAKLYYTGRFAAQVRSAEGLRDVLADYFGVPAEVEEFVGEWAEIPDQYRWRLGDVVRAPGQALLGRLGESTHLGSRVWLRQSRFRVALGPLTRAEFDALAPRGASLPELVGLVRGYAGDALCWDVRLKLKHEALADFQLGVSVLGRTSWLSAGNGARGARGLESAPTEDLVFDPQAVAGSSAPPESSAPL